MNKQKNKYYYRSHLSNAKFRQLLKCFAIALNAFEAHKITNISHRSCKIIYVKLRIYILTNHLGSSADTGVFELDESYFGAKRVRGKRGRGAAGKTPVFGLPSVWIAKKRWESKRDDKVYVEIVKNCSRASLMPIIQGKLLEGKYYSYRWLEGIRWTYFKNCSRASLMPIIQGKLIEGKYYSYRWLEGIRWTYFKWI